jgi:hypothetical protein
MRNAQKARRPERDIFPAQADWLTNFPWLCPYAPASSGGSDEATVRSE